jgi:hypothetical protein
MLHCDLDGLSGYTVSMSFLPHDNTGSCADAFGITLPIAVAIMRAGRPSTLKIGSACSSEGWR